MTSVIDIARDNSEAAMKRLAKLVNSEDEKVALAAANAILDRAVGKPKQSLDVLQKRDLADMSDAELADIASGGGEGNLASQEGADQSNPLH